MNRPLEAPACCALAGHRVRCRWGDGRLDNSYARRTAIALIRGRLRVELGDSEAIDLFLREEDAQAALEDALHDEPAWAGTLSVEPAELDEPEISAN